MKVITGIKEMQETSTRIRMRGATIGLVPTMGYFHQGHISLMEGSTAENDFTVVSLFVNPTQFGENEDFDDYPRDFERDKGLAEKAGVDILFVPAAEDMYPDNYSTYVNVYGLTDEMCGASRPGHFRGVATVITKLFNITLPHRAYFGQKDAQQALVVRKMVEDLNFPVEIRVMPVVREEDGLAMSSRNTYLSKVEREAALVIPKSLAAGKSLLEQGERCAARVAEEVTAIIKSEPLANIDYVVVKDADTLKDIKEIKGRVLVAVAVWIGKTRLIDNFIIEVPET